MEENNKYENFFEEIKKLKETQKKQKQRGLNDYNVLNTVLNYDDEVRLHSRMIGSLLDPDGKHYQETLFLEIFLKTIGWNDFDLNLEDTKVYVEYEDIDLYITDGSKHLIIENKIWANDQPCQITKYINIIVNENSESIVVQDDRSRLSPDVLRVIYLTPQSKKYPDQHALDDQGYIYFSDGDDQLKKCSEFPRTKELVPKGLKVFRAKYKKISYKNEILKWLEESRYEVQNITNLNEAIKQYIDVVKMITNQYKGKVMSILNYIKELKNDNQKNEYIEILDEINNGYQEEKLNDKKVFFMNEELLNCLNSKLKDGWKVERFGLEKNINQARKVQLYFSKKPEWKIGYILRFDENNMKKLYWTIARKNDKVIPEDLRENFKPKLTYRQTAYSLLWAYSKCDLDLVENFLLIINKKESELCQKILDEFEEVILTLENYNYTLETINSEIESLERS